MSATPSSIAPSVSPMFGWSLVLAVLLTLAGLFATLVPIVSGIAVALIVGWCAYWPPPPLAPALSEKIGR